MQDATGHPDFETFELDDTDDNLGVVGDAIEDAVKEQYDVPEDATIITYSIDAEVSQERFDVGALVLDE